MIDLPDIFNVTAHFVDRNVREGKADKIAIECEGERVSYGQLLERSNRVGNGLRELGVRMEERVVLLLPDSPEFLYAFFGVIKIGAVAVPINTFLKPHDYEYLLNDTRARVAIADKSLLSLLEHIPRERLKHLSEIIVGGEKEARHLSLRELMEAASPELEPQPTSRDDAAFWLYSSGSTGASKGCIHLHHDMVVCSELYAKQILNMTENDRCYSVA